MSQRPRERIGAELRAIHVHALSASVICCCERHLSTHAFLLRAFFRSRTRGCSCCCTALQIDTTASNRRLWQQRSAAQRRADQAERQRECPCARGASSFAFPLPRREWS